MTDLGKTQAEWNQFLGREVGELLLSPLRYLREAEDKFRLQRVQLVNWNDRASATPHITALTLAGINYGVNTSAAGRLFVRFVANGANWDVTLYKATGGGAGDAVAWAENIAASGTAALVALNSSGVSGSITLGATITGDTTDLHQIIVDVDFPARLPVVLSEDGTIEDDPFTRRDIAACYTRVAARLAGAKQDIRDTFARVMLASDGNQQARGNAFAGTAYNQFSAEVFAEDGDGNVTVSRTGLNYFLKDAMRDETTGGEQDVAKRTVSAGAGAFDSGNDGQGTVASHTPLENAVAARWVFECDDDTLGAERFRYLAVSTDGRVIARGTNGPVVGQQWSGPGGFGPITVVPTLSKTDGSSVLEAASTAAITGENSTNTNDGDIYGKVEANGSNWDVSFFKAESRHISTLVAKATNVAAGATFRATPQNQSGLTIDWELAASVSAVSDIVLSRNPFKRQNATGRADMFSVEVTVAANPGLYQTILAEELNAALNSDTAGSESISDDYVKRGTFVPYITQDN